MKPVFLSYAHADRTVAKQLQRRLQSFAKPWYRLKRLDVIRDESHFTTADALPASLKSALDKAGHFILLASPAARASPWVRYELEHWLASPTKRPIFLVLAGGELVWNERENDFDWELSTAVPRQLQGAFAAEPLWSNLRGSADAPEQVARLEDTTANLACAILGLPKDQLVGEDVRQHRRLILLRNLAIGGLSTLTVTSIGAAFVARRESIESEQRLAAGFELAVQSLETIETLRDIPAAAEARRKLVANNQRALQTLAPQLASKDRRLLSHTARAAVFEASEQMKQGDWTVAEQRLNEAERIYIRFPNDYWALYGLSDVNDRRAQVAAETGNVARRARALEDAVTYARRAAAQRPDDAAAGLEASLDNLGSFYGEVGRLQEAEALHREAATIAERLYAANPSNLDLLQDVVASYLFLYELSGRAGTPDVSWLRKAHALLHSPLPPAYGAVAGVAAEVQIAIAKCSPLPRTERAEACVAALLLAEDLLKQDTSNIDSRFLLARAHEACATAVPESAFCHLRSSRGILKALLENHPDFAPAQRLLLEAEATSHRQVSPRSWRIDETTPCDSRAAHADGTVP